MKRLGFHIFLGVVITAVSAAVVAGLLTVGSPNQERARQYDQQRVNELQNMSTAVDAYYQRNKVLPTNLAQLQEQREYYLPSVIDPRTGMSYEYQVTGTDAFELCATFETAALEADPRMAKVYPEPYPGRFWQHESGRVCFSMKAQKLPLP